MQQYTHVTIQFHTRYSSHSPTLSQYFKQTQNKVKMVGF